MLTFRANLFVIATYFPPAAGVCTFRIAKFVKYLPCHDWNVFVCSPTESEYIKANFPIDYSLVLTDAVHTVYLRSRTLLSLLRYLGPLNSLPIAWLPYLIINSLRHCITIKPSVIFATGDPFYPLIACTIISKILSIPYVVDFRDPWSLAPNPHPHGSLRRLITSLLDNILEPIVVNNAHSVVLVSEPMRSAYRDKYKNIPEKFHVIPNGFDKADYTGLTSHMLPKYSITYAGKLMSGVNRRDPSLFLQAVKLIIDRGTPLFFNYIGPYDQELCAEVTRLGLNEHVNFFGLMKFKDALSYLTSSDLLLVIGNGQETEQTGKIFDYIGCQKPILALANKNSSIYSIAQGISSVMVVPNKDPALIADAITTSLGTNIDSLSANIEMYNRASLTEQLDIILKDASRNG